MALTGCVDLTAPPPLQPRPDASMGEAGEAGGQATGGAVGTGGTGPATGPDAAADAGSGGTGGAGVDAAVADAGVDAADPVPIDAAADLAADLAVAVDVGAVAADASPDLVADVAPPPPDLMPDVVDAPPPTPIISFTDMSQILHAPGTGGTAFSAPCPGAGQAVTGVIGTSGGVVGLNSVQGTCAVVEATGPPPYQLTTRSSATLGPYGPVRPTMHDGSCPANQALVGFEGGSGSWINYLYLYCASLSITRSGAGYTVAVGAPTRLPTQLGTQGGTPFAARYCPAGQIAVGLLGAAGSAIDRFGFYCARPVAQ